MSLQVGASSGGRTGRTGSFFRRLLLHRKAMSLQVGGEFRGEDGSDGVRGRVGQCRTGRTGGARGFPECQGSLCHDCIQNKVSQIGLIGLIGKPDGGAVMAPLRRAGLTGSLLVQGDRSDLGLRGREGCRAGLPFRSALLREVDREAGRGRGWATGAMDAGSRW